MTDRQFYLIVVGDVLAFTTGVFFGMHLMVRKYRAALSEGQQ